MRLIFKRTLNFLFPSVCLVCHRDILTLNPGVICPLCVAAFPHYYGVPPYNRHLDQLWVPFSYEGSLRDALQAFKFRGRTELAPILSRSWMRAIGSEHLWPEVIVPVPSSWSRDVIRGFNPAERLAQSLGQLIGRPVVLSALRRGQFHRSQRNFNRLERFINAKAGFRIGPRFRKVVGKSVLLIDDICTTSATLSICAELLKKIGAEQVIGAAMAQDLLSILPHHAQSSN